jgi:glycogen debranching enzyme
LWHWTGDKELVKSILEPTLKSLQWLDRYGDLTQDGFYDYQTRSIQGNTNQGWKDSSDAIVYEDGSQVAAPIATCEEQAFVYAAKLQISEVLWWLDAKDEARRLYHQAQELKKRFHEAFWMEDMGFYAMALDSQGRQVRSIASDPGHCIASGIVASEVVARAADRLLTADLFSGWGIRTLSSEHPAYNPYSYHRGSIWPVEQGTFALGMMRYGLHRHMHTICRAQFEAASLFDFQRLPELFAGHPRDADHPFPAMYPNANWPQAWSSSQVFTLLQAMLGLYPYAPLHLLVVDPQLPEWLPEITLEGLRVGSASLDLRFYRQSDGSSTYELLDKRGHIHVVRQPSPWSLRAHFAERLIDVLTSILPGK